jgi:hypothetical protein
VDEEAPPAARRPVISMPQRRAPSTTAVVRGDAFRQGAAEGWVGAALTKSGDVGQVVGSLNTLFGVRGPCLVFKVAAS